MSINSLEMMCLSSGFYSRLAHLEIIIVHMNLSFFPIIKGSPCECSESEISKLSDALLYMYNNYWIIRLYY